VGRWPHGAAALAGPGASAYHLLVVALPRRLLPLLALLVVGCSQEPWSDTQQGEAIRMCRAQFGFPPISIFESQDASFTRRLCECEVEYLSTRVPYRTLQDRLRTSEVNRVLQVGGAHCLEKLGEHR